MKNPGTMKKAVVKKSPSGSTTRSKNRSKLIGAFEKFSNVITRAAGRPGASVFAFCFVIVWAVTGPLFGFSNTWQLIINTSTTIITFLMVFIIQQSQNKDTVALQLKLNELIACQANASNRLIDVEDLTADELEVLKKFYVELSELAESDSALYTTHSLDEAKKVHSKKRKKSVTETGQARA
jgi:low affinity Fe/Cu permease